MLSDLKACQSRIALAHLLRIEAKELSYVLYKIPDSSKYQAFCISKKNGGTRNILAPCLRLKWIQRLLLELLYECEDDLAASNQRSPNLDYGFRRKTNIYENANVHRGQRYVLNIDIEGYFNQFNFGRVRGYFIKNQDFGLHPQVATTIAQIACFDNVLPQGSPASPHIANLLTRFFDRRLTKFLRSRRCAYSRYADDITISTSLQEFPDDVAVPDLTNPQGWGLSPALVGIFDRSSLPINPAKTRMSVKGSRQMVTGLVVNQRPNVTREYYLSTRAMCHSLFNKGSINVPPLTPSFSDNCPQDEDEDKQKDSPDPLAVLEGRLAHIHHIREKSDIRTIQEKQDAPTQFWCTLLKFYIYKYFVGNRVPVILTEGPSDIFYLKTAIHRSTSTTIPELKETTSGVAKIIPSFFRFDTIASKVIGLTGGAGNIKRFLYLLNHTRGEFNQALRTKPVVIVIDNDSGGRDVLAQVNGMFKKNIGTADPQMVHQITKGLTLLKTPHVGTQQLTSIEDLLPPAVKAVTLNGKTFSAGKKIDTSKHFGKIPLAHYVRDNAASINFSGFDDMIEGLNEAIAVSPI